jgi:hypothetical protein
MALSLALELLVLSLADDSLLSGAVVSTITKSKTSSGHLPLGK